MRGRVHRMYVVGQRYVSGDDAGEVERDDEGRWLPVDPGSPTGPVQNEVWGWIGYPRTEERLPDEQLDAAANLPSGTAVTLEDDLVADTGDPLLDHRYEVIRIQPGRASIRVLLRRYASSA